MLDPAWPYGLPLCAITNFFEISFSLLLYFPNLTLGFLLMTRRTLPLKLPPRQWYFEVITQPLI